VAEDTWYSLALPLLEYLNQLPPHSFPSIGQIADALGADPHAVASEIDRLSEAGYIRGSLQIRVAGGDPRPSFINHAELAERGARAVGLWPAEDPYDALVALLEQRINEEPDEEHRLSLRKLGSALAGVGKATGTALLIEWAKGTIRF
jgi:predicted ArsR family transcriptional regulator